MWNLDSDSFVMSISTAMSGGGSTSRSIQFFTDHAIGIFDVITAIRFKTLFECAPPPRCFTKLLQRNAKTIGEGANQVVDQPGEAFVFIEWAHDLEPPPIVGNAPVTMGRHEILKQKFIVIPTQLLEN